VKVADLALSHSAVGSVVGTAPTAAETVVGAQNIVVVETVLEKMV